MYNSEMADELLEDDEDLDKERFSVNSALEFYRKKLKMPEKINSFNDEDQIYDQTKEFIIVKALNQNFMLNDQQIQNEIQQQDIIEEDIQTKNLVVSDEVKIENQMEQVSTIQEMKTINIKMGRQRQSYPSKFQSDYKKKELDSPAKEKFTQSEFVVSKYNQNGIGNDIEQCRQFCIQEPPKLQEQLIEENKNNGDAKFNGEEEDDEDENAIVKSERKVPYECCSITGQLNILKFAREFNFIKLKDEFRVPQAYKGGGTVCLDKGIIELSRSVGKTMIKEIGRKIISGDFNLTTVSFPIRAMIPVSGLEKTFMQTIFFPLYMNRAAMTDDPIERFRLVMVATICNYIQANTFLKPLNPILGETFEGEYEDGSQLYSEQVSHHPPVSYFLQVGPNKSYRFSGYYLYEAKAGLNSLTFSNSGKRLIEFSNQVISYNFTQEIYSGTFMGTMKHESQGQIKFIDQLNGINATLTIGGLKKKPSDFVEGEIVYKNRIVSKMNGTYMGFLEFDGKRYWDARQTLPFKMMILKSQLESDSSKRKDLVSMLSGDMLQAQIEKESLELLQRNDTKLRKNYEKILEKEAKKVKK